MKKKRILFMYSEVMSYTYDILLDLIDNFNVELFLIHWDDKKRHPYNFNSNLFYRSIQSSKIILSDILKELTEFRPDLVYCSGTMDKRYLKIITKLDYRNISVMGSDTQWHGSFVDYFKVPLSFFLYRRYFKFAWVSGFQQYEYCRKMGFARQNIIFNLYSSPNVFKDSNTQNVSLTKKKILFVGRDAKVKNIEFLVNVFKNFSETDLNGWTLYLVGSESFRKFEIPNKINSIPFVDSEKLATLADDFDAFILPSINEPWGVVVHEFCYKGLIMLLSDRIGSSDLFLIDGYNGYSFDAKESCSLKNVFQSLFLLKDLELSVMKNNSITLANRINTRISSSSLFSLIYKTNFK